MRIAYEGVSEGSLDPGRHAAFVDALADRIQNTDAFYVVVAQDFVASVRRHTPDPREAAQYDADRLFGQATAKTFVRGDDVCLIVDADFLRRNGNTADHDPVRLAAHEAYHASIHQRGECVTDLHERRELPTFTRIRYFIECASILVEEYRVERALATDGLALHASYRGDLPLSLRNLHAQIVDATNLRHPNEGIGRCAKTVMEAFSGFTTLCAYLIADNRETPAPLLDPLGRTLAGEHYDVLAAALDDCPSAAIPTPRPTLDSYVDRLVGPLDQWLRHIGFAVEDRGNGLYFDVLRTDWDTFDALAP